jgi:hypothetical protein
MAYRLDLYYRQIDINHQKDLMTFGKTDDRLAFEGLEYTFDLDTKCSV